jgi:hypothetical protein
MVLRPLRPLAHGQEPPPVTLSQICLHDHAAMRTRQLNGYEQHDSHVWCWLIEMLRIWGEAHPIRVIE